MATNHLPTLGTPTPTPHDPICTDESCRTCYATIERQWLAGAGAFIVSFMETYAGQPPTFNPNELASYLGFVSYTLDILDAEAASPAEVMRWLGLVLFEMAAD